MRESKKTDAAKIEHRRLREIDAAAATAEYHAAKAADLKNMVQLKTLRLAKEAADRAAKPAAGKSQRSGKPR